ncbi:MAG: hypothetical protein H7241_01885 [Novosphingobium sp.]|nr:hypothetical protein [Novosphingobium sp.]
MIAPRIETALSGRFWDDAMRSCRMATAAGLETGWSGNATLRRPCPFPDHYRISGQLGQRNFIGGADPRSSSADFFPATEPIPESFQNVVMIAAPIVAIPNGLKAKACSSCPAFNRTG